MGTSVARPSGKKQKGASDGIINQDTPKTDTPAGALTKLGATLPPKPVPFYKPGNGDRLRIVAVENVGGYTKTVTQKPKEGQRDLSDATPKTWKMKVYCDVYVDRAENDLASCKREVWQVGAAGAMHALDAVPDVGEWFRLAVKGAKKDRTYRVEPLPASELKMLVERVGVTPAPHEPVDMQNIDTEPEVEEE